MVQTKIEPIITSKENINSGTREEQTKFTRLRLDHTRTISFWKAVNHQTVAFVQLLLDHRRKQHLSQDIRKFLDGSKKIHLQNVLKYVKSTDVHSKL